MMTEIEAAQAHLLIEEVKDSFREKATVGCRMLSLGDECRCVLCLCDQVHNLISGKSETCGCCRPKSYRPAFSSVLPKEPGYLICVCGATLQTTDHVHQHWTLGHFDKVPNAC